VSAPIKFTGVGVEFSRNGLFATLFAGGSLVMAVACWSLAVQRELPLVAGFVFALWLVAFAVVLATVRITERRLHRQTIERRGTGR
jgi:chromate transport protein ChrA